MTRAKASRLAAEHGLGRVIDVIGVRQSWVLLAVVWSPALLGVPALVIKGLAGGGWDALGFIVALALPALVHAFVDTERIVVCEGGLLLGMIGPIGQPYRLRWSEVDPTTIAAVTPYARVFTLLSPGQPSLATMSSARRGPAHGGPALCLAGPSVDAAALGRSARPEPPNTRQGGNLWFSGCGEAGLDRVRAAIVTALTPVLGGGVADVDARLRRPIVLGDDPHAIPGYADPFAGRR